jgi:Cu(I)/Ag(I) efflux system membrane protein CusA/SilA
MRFGENALQVIERVKARLRNVQRTLPEGVSIIPTYDRSDLIQSAIATMRNTVIEELCVVALVVVVFIAHWRSALVPLVTLPIAVLGSFIPLFHANLTANIMSLGGIAIAIGVLVDASLVMVENGYRRVFEQEHAPGETDVTVLIDSARQVGRPVFFSLVVIITSFMPVFLLEGEEGRMFRPLAITKTAAMVGASLLAITLVPVLMLALMQRRGREPRSPGPISAASARLYEPILRWTLRRPATTIVVSGLFVPLAIPLAASLGREFMPPLFEGTILYMPTAPPGLSITEATRLLQRQDRVLTSFPEVRRVFGTAGRATTATDNSPVSMVTTTVTLKPRREWRHGMSLARLQADMDQALQLPGFPNVWTQPIRGRLDMLSTGIKTPVGIKILGPDLTTIDALGRRIEDIVKTVPGTRSVYAERVMDGSFADIRVDRAAIGRYGLTVDDVEAVVNAAIGGATVTTVLEGRARFPVSVRYQPDFRDDLQALAGVLVKTPTGAQVPLGQLATIALTTGPAMIRGEDGELAGYVYIDAPSRDIGGYVASAQDEVERRLSLPTGFRLKWAGQYEHQVRAAARLRILVPVVVAVIFVLLYLTFHSASEALTLVLSVVYAMTGGVVLQWLLGYNFSVAVWVGYIALFGVAVQTGIVMVMYLNEAFERRRDAGTLLSEHDVLEATVTGAVLRLRPKLMTVTTTVLGLVPIFWSTGTGADLMKPIAAPLLGGILTSALHVLLVTPTIFFLMKRRDVGKAAMSSSEGDGTLAVVGASSL